MTDPNIDPNKLVNEGRVQTDFKGETVGDATLNLIEAAGVQLTPEFKAEMRVITDDEAMSQLLDADLGSSIRVKPLNAQIIFGKWLMTKMEIPPLMMSWWFYAIGTAKDTMDYTSDMLKRDGLEEPTQLELLKLRTNASVGLGVLLEKMQAMAREVGALKPPPTPKNRPPNLLMQTNVIVQQPVGKPETSI
jgi:hypothetical protein